MPELLPGSIAQTLVVTRSVAQRNRTELTRSGWPKMAFIERRLAHDPTNWWAPNHAAVEAMLRSAGLAVLERPGHEIYVCEPAPPREETAWIETELRIATGRPLPGGNGGNGG